MAGVPQASCSFIYIATEAIINPSEKPTVRNSAPKRPIVSVVSHEGHLILNGFMISSDLKKPNLLLQAGQRIGHTKELLHRHYHPGQQSFPGLAHQLFAMQDLQVT
jgi:hypothetical protein